MKQILTVILIIMGGILGTAVGDVCINANGLQWLAIGGTIGLKEPVIVSLSFLEVTFGFWCKLNIGGVLGLVLFAFLSSKVTKWVKL
ncbi:hypothetical protein D3C76_1290730 [compost metagenome]